MPYKVFSSRTLVGLLHVFIVLTVLITIPTPMQKPSHYNFIVIMADDLGTKELGCYNNPSHRTPNLDRIATEGMRFRTAWSTRLRILSRAMILTSQYPHH
jgi:hypothetical protein